METWYEAGTFSDTITPLCVIQETAHKVKIRLPCGTTYYDTKTSYSCGEEFHWIRRDRDEAKRLLLKGLERSLHDATSKVEILQRRVAAIKKL